MKVVISYADGSKNFTESDQKKIDYFSVSTYANDEIELDTFSDVFDLSSDFGKTIEVGDLILRDGERLPHIFILNYFKED